MRYATIFLSLLLYNAPSWANAAQEATTYLPLAAHYREARVVAGKNKESADWYFIRQDRQIETARAGYAEVWRRDERGELTWQRVFHDDRKLVEYTPGQLRTENRVPAWNTLNTVIDVKRLADLKPVGHAPVFKRAATHYRGKLGDERIEVVWLNREAIPARITRKGKEATYTLTLLALRDAPDPAWPKATPAQTGDYQFIDGADLGDMEYDPFVARLLGTDTHHSAHGGHHH
jgi:hypothetical protein